MKTICFTVTNDLSYDQRMIRICSTLSAAGYKVILIGRKKSTSPLLANQPFQQIRLNCFLSKGSGFYAEYNIRLFFYLLFCRIDAVCAIDLDTVLPCLWVSKLKKIKRVFDAHELFCEMKEVVSRPRVYRIWKAIEKYALPQFNKGYTVNLPLSEAYEKNYGLRLQVIRNMPRRRHLPSDLQRGDYILYQGAVNEGRCFETLLPAMKLISCQLMICGDGNFMQQAQQLVAENEIADKVIFKGMVSPGDLFAYTSRAIAGITLFESDSLNNYYSLANRYFDYIQAGTPQLAMNYPAYAALNQMYATGVLIDKPTVEQIAEALLQLLNDKILWNTLHNNCLSAAEVFCWEEEEKKLIAFYQHLFE